MIFVEPFLQYNLNSNIEKLSYFVSHYGKFVSHYGKSSLNTKIQDIKTLQFKLIDHSVALSYYTEIISSVNDQKLKRLPTIVTELRIEHSVTRDKFYVFRKEQRDPNIYSIDVLNYINEPLPHYKWPNLILDHYINHLTGIENELKIKKLLQL